MQPVQSTEDDTDQIETVNENQVAQLVSNEEEENNQTTVNSTNTDEEDPKKRRFLNLRVNLGHST